MTAYRITPPARSRTRRRPRRRKQPSPTPGTTRWLVQQEALWLVDRALRVHRLGHVRFVLRGIRKRVAEGWPMSRAQRCLAWRIVKKASP